MNNKYRHFIEGEKIYLREVRLSDANDDYYRWLNDPEVNQYLETRFIPQSEENIKRYIEKMDGNPHEIFLAVCLKENDRHLGNIKLGPINWVHRFADISLVIGAKDYWGKGVATEAITLVTNFAFRVLGLHKVKAGCYHTNTGSRRAFEKAGFEEEGCLSKQFYCNGEYVDWILMARNNH